MDEELDQDIHAMLLPPSSMNRRVSSLEYHTLPFYFPIRFLKGSFII